MAEVQPKNSSKRGRPRKKIHLNPDMTPMVDLAFLLLTFFMLATTFLGKDRTLQIFMPEKPTTERPVNCNKVISLLIGNDNKLYYYTCKANEMQQTEISANGLHKLLLEKHKQFKNMEVLIKPMDKASYGRVVAVIDEMNTTGTPYMLLNVNDEEKQQVALL